MKMFTEEDGMLKINKKRFLVVLAVLLALGTTTLFTTGFVVGHRAAYAKSDTYEELRAFTRALELIRANYVEEPNTKDLIQGAIRGMVSSLDPHSSYMTERAFKEINMDIKGEFQGVGIQISIKNQQLTVISPIEDTPADRAGIAAEDKILKINDEWTKDMSIEDAVDRMRGPKGSTVRLLIFREGWEKPKEFKIVRDVIKVQSVKSRMLQDDIGYMKIIQFQGQTANEVEKALVQLEEKGMKELVLDLRNNPGGLLDASVDVSSLFLPKDKLVVYIQGRRKDDRKDFLSSGTEFRQYPVVVLVNAGSASASEIVAGALQDSHRAVVVGTQTFGKGSVQTVFPLEGGTGIRLTTAKYYTPSGRSIQNVGITPDIEVKLPIVKEATNGETAGHMIVRERDLERHLKNDTIKDQDQSKKKPPKGETEDDFVLESVPKNDKDDIQLQRAIELLKTGDIFKNLPPKNEPATALSGTAK
jgi:carboxyl-terminal processing protease